MLFIIFYKSSILNGDIHTGEVDVRKKTTIGYSGSKIANYDILHKNSMMKKFYSDTAVRSVYFKLMLNVFISQSIIRK